MRTAFKKLIQKSAAARLQRRIKRALALEKRGEARSDGLEMQQACVHLAVSWWAREIHPWDCDASAGERGSQFFQQTLNDTEAAIRRLFEELPQLDVISVKVIDSESSETIIAGVVHRSCMIVNHRSVRMRLIDWGLKFYSDGSQFEASGRTYSSVEMFGTADG